MNFDVPAYSIPGPEQYLDPRYDWVEVTKLGGPTQYVRGACRHLDVVPVTDVTGEVVASLCPTCDVQFPGGRA